jgi:hypothetical protein
VLLWTTLGIASSFMCSRGRNCGGESSSEHPKQLNSVRKIAPTLDVSTWSPHRSASQKRRGPPPYG